MPTDLERRAGASRLMDDVLSRDRKDRFAARPQVAAAPSPHRKDRSTARPEVAEVFSHVRGAKR